MRDCWRCRAIAANALILLKRCIAPWNSRNSRRDPLSSLRRQAMRASDTWYRSLARGYAIGQSREGNSALCAGAVRCAVTDLTKRSEESSAQIKPDRAGGIYIEIFAEY